MSRVGADGMTFFFFCSVLSARLAAASSMSSSSFTTSRFACEQDCDLAAAVAGDYSLGFTLSTAFTLSSFIGVLIGVGFGLTTGALLTLTAFFCGD